MSVHRAEVLLPVGFACAIGACVTAALVFIETTARVALMVAAVGLFGVWARRCLPALAAGVMAWCFATGFLVHAKGELSFGTGDLFRLGVFAASALTGCAWAALRVRRRRRPWPPARSRAGRHPVPILLRLLHTRPVPRR
ncbi:hypothetical protein [Nonomuraea jiangxiensis]|uniref:Uncharacterized protein n=1 Tax=Nonomuraea jiangxiensis TaxID=633440 RepID=A0A1G8W5I2_9ACTN|nr:hypothetical protein [Nonomuraea jiangxiensis]SDJ73363.1 hypothetical protein SAMN05421869_11253 [Nonomuraea jiangxiensis]